MNLNYTQTGTVSPVCLSGAQHGPEYKSKGIAPQMLFCLPSISWSEWQPASTKVHLLYTAWCFLPTVQQHWAQPGLTA